MTYQELFIDNKDVLIIHKSLANILGDLNEAVVLNQLNYWIERYKETNHNFKDGKYWVYNSYKQWAIDNFPFWSETTVKRTFTRLENKGIVVSANYNKMSIDKTKWYSIDYKKLQEFIDNQSKDQNEPTKDHKDQSTGQNDFSSGHNEKAIPETTTDNTNRDYITDTTDNSFSKEKVNSNSPQGECNSFSGEKKYTRRPKQNKPLSEKELEQANCKIPYRASKIAYKLTENRDLSNNVFKFFEYFLDERKKHTGTWHIPLSDTTLAKVVATLIEDIKVDRGDYEDTYFSLVIDELGNADYEEVIDKYFKTKFKNKVDYSIVHFTQENVLINIMNHCGKENWCMSV